MAFLGKYHGIKEAFDILGESVVLPRSVGPSSTSTLPPQNLHHLPFLAWPGSPSIKLNQTEQNKTKPNSTFIFLSKQTATKHDHET